VVARRIFPDGKQMADESCLELHNARILTFGGRTKRNALC